MSNEINLAPAKLMIPSRVPFQPKVNQSVELNQSLIMGRKIKTNHVFNFNCIPAEFKDGAYYCYCAYVLRISRYSGFLWVVPTNTGIILRGLKL